MLNSITRTLLTSAMGFAWDTIRVGVRGVERCDAIGITDPEKPYAGFVEKTTHQMSHAMVHAGEGLERFVSRCSIRLLGPN
jgi:hypothetical protein